MRNAMSSAGPAIARSSTLNTTGGLTSSRPDFRLCQSRACAGVICQYSGLPALRMSPRTYRACQSTDGFTIVCLVLHERMRFVDRLENVRGDAPPRQCFTELQPQERTGRIPRSRRVVVSLHVTHHRGI